MRRLRARAPYYAYRGGSIVANALPAPVAYGLARAGGVLTGTRESTRRTMLRRHLRRAYGPAIDERELDRHVRDAFESYARYWMEMFRLPHLSPAELDAGMSYEGLERIDDALQQGKGVIAVLPHLGGWDFGGAWLSTHGYPLTVVVEDLQPPELFDWFAGLRGRLGLTIVRHGPEAAREVLRALRENQLVALLSDRDLTGEGVPVEFFGEETTLPAGPATLALRTGAALLPMALYYEGRGHFGVVRPPISVAREGSLREDVARITQLMAGELEALIRRAPDQWHLMQPNWPSDFELVRASTTA